jgi:3-ketoacyl-CoA synthase
MFSSHICEPSSKALYLCLLSHLPLHSLLPCAGDTSGASTGIEACRKEYTELCFGAIEELLAKTGVKPHQIKFVITNSSLFNPTPSLSASIINRFKLPHTTINYSLGGMGCSAGVVALDLARSLLELNPNSYALVVSHENITNAWYCGHDRTMMVPNCLFRANGSAVLLSNRPMDASRSKYRLQHLVRTILAADDEAFNCVRQGADAEHKVGVSLQKELIAVASRALKTNLTTLGPKVLPLSEKMIFAGNVVARQLGRRIRPLGSRLPASWLKPYTPNFGKAFNHSCIHTGGRGVIDGIEKQLGLSQSQVLPSRAALYRFGNTSSTSIWYVLAFIESYQGVRKGDRVWQLGFGSGFKCNSAVWVANRKVQECHRAWDGFDCQAMMADLEEIRRSRERYLAAKRAQQAAAAAAPEGSESGSSSE